MITSNDVVVIRQACTQYGIPIPKAVAAAETLHNAAVDLLAGIRAETVPDLETLTLKNMVDIHAQIVARTTFETRQLAAIEIEANTVQSCIFAWHQSAGGLCEAFRKPFDEAAGAFTEAYNALDGILDADRSISMGTHAHHQALMSSAADLKVLAIVRDALAASLPVDVGASGGSGLGLDRLGRILTVPNWDTIARVVPVRTGGLLPFSVEWFAALVSIPGVVLQWHGPSEQQNVAQLARHNKVA